MAVSVANNGMTVGNWRTHTANHTDDVALRWFAIALLVRLFLGTLIHLYSANNGFEGFYPFSTGGDDRLYWDAAVAHFQGTRIYVSTIYPSVLIALFLFTGPSLLLGKLLNVVAGALTVYIGVHLVQLLTDRGSTRLDEERSSDQAAHWAGGLLTFYPASLFYTTQLMKDSILVLLGISAIYLSVRFLRRPQLAYAGLWLASTGALFLFRFYSAAALVFSLLLFMIYSQRQWRVPSFVAAAILLLAVWRGWFGLSIVRFWLDLGHIADFRRLIYSGGGSSTGIQFDSRNPLTFLLSYGYSFTTAMFGPFPWQVDSAVQVIALPEAAVMWLLSPILAGGIFRLLRRRPSEEALLLVFSVVLIGAVALLSDNVGANTRLRMLPWNVFLLYAALHMPRIRLL